MAEELDKIVDVCAETLKPVGLGRHYRNMRYRVMVYLSWLVSEWMIGRLTKFFRMLLLAAQRTIPCAMSGLAHSLRVAYPR